MRAFYLAYTEEVSKLPRPVAQDDKPSIGIILCKAKNKVEAEYALRDLAKPVGISSYVTKLIETLPKEFRGSLPSPKELEAELRGEGSEEG
jgi:hypothetical protein